MTELDVRTLYVGIAAITVLLSVVSVAYWRTQRVYAGFGLWALSNCFLAVSSIVYALRGEVPNAASVMLGGVFAVMSATFWLEGMRRFLGRRRFDLRTLAIPVIATVLLAWWTFVQDDPFVRTLIVGATGGVLLWAIVGVIARNTRGRDRAVYLGIGLPFFLYGGFAIGRGIYWFVQGSGDALLGNNLINISFLLTTLVLDVVWTVIFIAMTHLRTTRELEAEKQTSDDARTRLESIIDFLPDLTFVVDLDGNVVAWNRAAEQQLGIGADQLVGRPVRDAFAPVLPPAGHLLAEVLLDPTLDLSDRYLQVEREGEALSAVVDTDGLAGPNRSVWARAVPLRNAAGTVVGVVESIRDITKIVQTERLLEQSEARYRSLFECSAEAVLMTRTDRTVLDANPAACAMFRMTREELRESGCEIVKMDESIERALQEREQTGSISGRLTCIRRDGTTFPAEGTSTIVPNGGDPPLCFSILRDVSERVAHETQLAESEERFRTLVEVAPQPIFIQIGGRFVYANRAANALFGEKQGAPLEGQLVEERMHPEFREALHDRMRRTEMGEAVPPLERSIIDAEGNLVEVEGLAVPFPYQGQRAALVFATDITERKRAERELRENQARLLRAQSVAHVGDFEVDVATRTATLSAESWRICGHEEPPDVASAELVFGMVFEEDLPSLLKVMQEGRGCGRGVEHEFRIRRAGDGSVRTVRSVTELVFDDAGVPEKVVGVMEDVTERRQAEETLRLTQYSVDHAFDAVFWTDPDGRLIYVSDSACESMGYTREELLTMAVWDIDPTGSLELWQKNWEALRSRGGDTFETVNRKKNGEVIPVEVSLNYVVYLGREYTCTFARDIRERRRAESALRDSEERLRQSQKMEAIGRLAGGIAHDFNNLLTAIIGYSDLALANEAARGLPIADDILEIRAAADRAGALTSQILAFSRRQELKPAVVSLNDILTGMEPLLARTLGEDIELLIRRHPDLGMVEVDTHQFEQVIMNLAVNARDAMPLGGRLVFETGNIDFDEHTARAHPDAIPGSYAVLSVADTGIGMDLDTASHVFEPFFTTKGPGEGTGLGLATVHGIVHQSGGTIDVFSEPGTGTMFRVLLPRVEGVVQAALRDVAVEAPACGGENILVVEDDASLRNLVSRVLKDLGYKTIAVDDAERALVFLEDDSWGIDLLLTDIVLPGAMRGDVLAERAIVMRPGLPVLRMSGYTQEAFVHGAGLHEGVNFLAKPFTPDVLAKMVRDTLDRAGSGGTI